MKTYLDCIPCFVHQAVEVARRVSDDPAFQEKIVREILKEFDRVKMSDPPPVMGQFTHRRLREITGLRDPYQSAKERQNRMALELLPALKAEIAAAADPLSLATRLAIAGNIIDLGVNGNLTESDILESIHQALQEPLAGDWEKFRDAVAEARDILYLADNAGEIIFDRLLIEQILPKPITLVVRGAPVINDALREDACCAGLDRVVTIIDNGSDAPGTVLNDCSAEFRRRLAVADLIIAKGQGNYETLSDEPYNIFFLFKVKCQVIARHVGQPEGTQVLIQSGINKRCNPEPVSSGKEKIVV